MEKPDGAIETLGVFGLSRNQAKMYLAIIKLGSATVGEIASASGIRREDVYRALPRLEKLGLIEKDLGAPSKIRVVSLESALSGLIKQQQEETNRKISELLSKKEKFLRDWQSIVKGSVSEEPSQFSLLHGKNAVFVKIESLVKDSEGGIDYLVPKKQLGNFISSYGDLFKSAARRKIEVRILAEMPEESGGFPELVSNLVSSGGISLRWVDSVPIHFGIYDRKEVLSATSVVNSIEDGPVLYSKNQPLVQALQKMFDDLWKSSVDWDSARIAGAKSTPETSLIVSESVPVAQSEVTERRTVLINSSLQPNYDLLLNYVKKGLDTNQVVLLMIEEETPDIKKFIKECGANKHRLKAGALSTVTCSEFAERMADTGSSDSECIRQEFSRALARGFSGMRVVRDMAFLFRASDVDELAEFEKMLHERLNVSLTAILAYNVQMIGKLKAPAKLYIDLFGRLGAYQIGHKDIGRQVTLQKITNAFVLSEYTRKPDD